MILKTCLIIIAGLLASFCASVVADPEVIVVCYPGGYVNIKDANGAMNAMLRVVERVGNWQEHSFDSMFSAKTDDCRQLMAAKHPKFAFTSLGLYLELRSQYSLAPLVQPNIQGRSTERYRVMVKKDSYRNLDELKGKTLGGTVLEEQAFISKIVFAGKYALADYFVLKSSSQAIRALRALDKGELDAMVLNEQQFGGLASLHLDSALEAVFTSAEIPLIGVVANTAATTPEERVRFGKALVDMCTDAEGKKLCELFGMESFASVEAAVFEPMVKLWSEGK